MITQALFRATCFAALSFSCIAFSTNGNAQIINTIAGNGTPGFSGDGGLATAASLMSPNGVDFDGGGNLFISDGYRLRKVATSNVITNIAGTGIGGFSGDGGPASAAQIEAGSVACDASGNIYIVSGNRVRKINTSGIISTIGGTGSGGYSGDGGPATAAQLNSPVSLKINGSDIFIADLGNSCVRKINAAGIISTVAGNGTSGFSGDGGAATAAQLNTLRDLAIDAAGNLYIADEGNYRIRKVNTAGIISTIAGTGAMAYGGDGGPASAAQIGSSMGICLDASNNIFIADGSNARIRKISTSGIITTFAGTGVYGFSGDGGPATAAKLYYPNALVMSAGSELYIADAENNRVRKVNNPAASVTNMLSLNAKLNIFPNPSKGSFAINLSIPGKEEVELVITNATGRIVKELTLTPGREALVNLNVPTGIYYLTAETKSGRVVEKIVVE